ncbi:hypothetical protein E2542_SST24441 [Spatholobus suberectus]|nr:hypothetical protein E2542_SST24441 [Spatholobus suberectus]
MESVNERAESENNNEKEVKRGAGNGVELDKDCNRVDLKGRRERRTCGCGVFVIRFRKNGRDAEIARNFRRMNLGKVSDMIGVTCVAETGVFSTTKVVVL